MPSAHKATASPVYNSILGRRFALLLSLLLVAVTGLQTLTGNAAPDITPAQIGRIENLPRLGIEALSTDEASLGAMSRSGSQAVRVFLSWSIIEPVNGDPSSFVWAPYDALFGRIAANNLAPIVVVLGCPSWACQQTDGPLYDNREPDFAQFMGAVAARYSRPPYYAHYWELWNEPDSTTGVGRVLNWGMHPAGYVGMLRYAAPAVKAADPNAAIILGGIAYDYWFDQGGPFNPDFLPDVLSAGGAQYLDAVAFHYYRNNTHGWTNVGIKAEEIRGVLQAGGAGSIPLLCTESGQTSEPAYGGSEELQARYLVQMHAHGAAAHLQGQVWFLNRDYTDPRPSQQVFLKSGLIRLDNSLKPSYYATRVLAAEIGSGSFIRPLGAADGVSGTLEGYEFRRNSNGLLLSLVWNNDPVTTTFAIPPSVAFDWTRTVNLYGREQQPTVAPDGSLLFDVGLDPIYIEWYNRFEDVHSDHWAYRYIEYLAARNVVGGYPDATFRPAATATRAQFSKMLVLGMAWPIDAPPAPHFNDVGPANVFYPYVETAYGRGIIGGYPCGAPGEPCPGLYFRPSGEVSRGQITKMTVRAKGWPLLDPPTATFADVPRGSSFFTYVETSVARSVITGYPDHTFRPSSSATRAQLSKILNLTLQQP